MSDEKTGAANDEKQSKDNDGATVNLGRHQAQCSICLSPLREDIDQLFIDWCSPDVIAKRYTGISRDSIYRHARAVGLFPKRRKNVSIALEKIIERVDWIEMSGSVVLSAIKLCVKLNGVGQGTAQAQGTDPKKLLESMSKEERKAFARDGSLPDWFSGAIGATPGQGQEGEKAGQITETKTLQ